MVSIPDVGHNLCAGVMATQEEDYVKSDEFDTSDENERPSGERWAPVGANDGDSDFTDDYKCSDNMESISYNMDRLKILEEEQEMLNSSLIALTTHFAQVQFRLRQIVDAPTDEKEKLLKELEEFAFRGIPDVPNAAALKNRSASSVSLSEKNGSGGFDEEVESKIALQKTKQRELIEQLKTQLEDLERYAYETDGQDVPQSVLLERQNMIINHLKEKLNFEVDDIGKLPLDDLRWQVDHAINEIVSPLKMKEHLVHQLQTQVADLERFIHYLQGEVSTETLACTCACPVHTTGTVKPAQKPTKRQIPLMDRSEDNHTKTINTVRKVITLLHLYLMSQLGCSSQRNRDKKSNKTTWRDLRTRLDIAIEHVLEIAAENEENSSSPNDNDDDDLDLYGSDTESPKQHANAKLTSAVRKHLAICIRDLMMHGLTADIRANSVVPFIGCFPQRRSMTVEQMHPWELIVKYYEFKNGHRYLSSPAQKLSQSFNLELVSARNVSPKQSLLTTVGNIIATHTPYKRSYNSHFKAFICAALNAQKLVPWLRLILQCQYLLENHYMSWSYVIKTGFQDAFHALDRLTNVHFDLPVDLAVRQFQNIKDAF